MGDGIGDFADKAKRIAADSAEELQEKMAAFKSPEDLERLKDAAAELADEAAVFIRKHPIASVAGALAAGFVLGSILSRGK